MSKKTIVTIAVYCLLISSFSISRDDDKLCELDFFEWYPGHLGVSSESGSENEQRYFQKVADTESQVTLLSSTFIAFSKEIDQPSFWKKPSNFMAVNTADLIPRWTIIQPSIVENRWCSVEYFFRVHDQPDARYLRVSIFAVKRGNSWSVVEQTRTRVPN
jgi:hypothetical protein